MAEPPPDAQRAAALDASLGPWAESLVTPALVIDLDALDRNLRALCSRCGGPEGWRPHIKTLKQSHLIRRLLHQGVRHLKCATTDELGLALETAASNSLPVDLLVAYPHRGANLVAAMRVAAAHPGARVHWLANDPEHLEELVLAGEGQNSPESLSVFLDVDLGMARTGSPPATWTSTVEAAPQTIQLAGLHGYDGHHGHDARAAAHAGYDALVTLAARHPSPDQLELVTSGTHSYAHALTHSGLRDGPWVHRISPGTVVLSDLRSAPAAQDLGLESAAFVMSRVVSTRPGRLTLDAGSKAITPDAAGPSCRVLGFPRLTPLRASEEHLPCRVEPAGVQDTAAVPCAGERVWLLPDHVCTTVNLHREVVYVSSAGPPSRGEVEASGRRVQIEAPA